MTIRLKALLLALVCLAVNAGCIFGIYQKSSLSVTYQHGSGPLGTIIFQHAADSAQRPVDCFVKYELQGQFTEDGSLVVNDLPLTTQTVYCKVGRNRAFPIPPVQVHLSSSHRTAVVEVRVK